ncbi:hypothetical protein RYX36_033737 [Vicia faba]
MRLSGMVPYIVLFIGVISSCANLAYIKQANSLLDLYTKCCQIDLATKIFDHIQHKDVASWNTMILGYGMLGELDNAINLFEAMNDNDIEYGSVLFISVLSTCSHKGLIEKGNKYFKKMKKLQTLLETYLMLTIFCFQICTLKLEDGMRQIRTHDMSSINHDTTTDLKVVRTKLKDILDTEGYLLGDEADGTVVVEHVNDGSGIGAALLAVSHSLY